MAKRLAALVEPAILKWARESAGYSIEEIARRFNKEPEIIQAWEEERAEDRPYMGVVRDLAQLYKRPISDFFLPAPPQERPMPHDFRRSPGEVAGRYSPALRKQLRFARERQDLASALFGELDERLPHFEQRANRAQGAEAVGAHIRRLLNMSIQEQRAWRDPRVAFRAWRSRIEHHWILVFQFEDVSVDEAWGFSIVEPELPVIGVNVALAPNGRTFTMIHELVHVLLGIGGICDIDDYTPRAEQDLQIEVFCNHAAAAALMPRDAFLANPIVASRQDVATNWTDAEIAEIATEFSVSREAVVRRLLTFDRTTLTFYQQKRAAYRAQREAQKRRERDAAEGQRFGRNMARRAVSNLGSNYVKLILNSYNEERITLSDAAGYLDVRAPKVRRSRKWSWGASAWQAKLPHTLLTPAH